MKRFFQDYSYSIIKMFVNQFAISMFGVILAMAAISASNRILTLVVGAFSVLFYLFLIYTMTWEIGAKDRISVDVGKKPYRPHTGLFLSLVANIPNLLIAFFYLIASPFAATHTWAANMNAVLYLISALLEGMYLGLTTRIMITPDLAMMRFWWCYFLIVLPALITAWLAYFAGFKNFRILAQYFNKTPGQGNKK